MTPIEQIFFLSLALFLAIGLLALCHKIDRLEEENENLKIENEDLENDLLNSK